VVVNDATRSTPTEAMLSTLLPSLLQTPNWQVIVATGLHRAPAEFELHRIFGNQLSQVRSRLLIHNGYDQASLQAWESTDGPVYINQAVASADRLVLLSSVEPHFFAGYTGGRKSIVPGLAGKDSVQRSHAGAVFAEAGPLRIDGNPVREYIHKNTMFIDQRRAWSIQTVLDAHDRLAAAFAGDIDKTFDAACAVARKYYVQSVARAYDIVLAAVYPPLDINLYQAQKGWELSQLAVKDDGVLVVTSPCTEGAGSPFYARLSETFPNKGEWTSLATRPYTMGLHKLVRTGRARSRIRLMAVTNMPATEIERYGYEAHASVDDAIRAAIAHVGLPARALVVEDAALTTITRDAG
jgi:nickel-dependent lactate racemase